MNTSHSITAQQHPGSTYPQWSRCLPDGRTECLLCPRFCRLREGQRGFCFVRKNLNNQIVLTSYGRSSGFCIDPIEKKPLNHFYPGTSVLSFGTAGCNLGCRFCQNWSISKSRVQDRLSDQATPEKIARVAKQLHCQSVAFTYNDPVIFAEYAIDVAKACHEHDIRTVAVTAGYMTQNARPEFFAPMDAVNVDLKSFSEDFYKRTCSGKLQDVLDTLEYIVNETNTWLELTTLLIPGENDNPSELHAASEWIAKHLGTSVPWHFTAFHPDYKMQHRPSTPKQTLQHAKAIAESTGHKYVYVGNVHDPTHSSTYCPNCAECVIKRDWFELGEYKLRNDQCKACGESIPGRFGRSIGSTSPTRRPVRLADFD